MLMVLASARLKNECAMVGHRSAIYLARRARAPNREEGSHFQIGQNDDVMSAECRIGWKQIPMPINSQPHPLCFIVVAAARSLN